MVGLCNIVSCALVGWFAYQKVDAGEAGFAALLAFLAGANFTTAVYHWWVLR